MLCGSNEGSSEVALWQWWWQPGLSSGSVVAEGFCDGSVVVEGGLCSGSLLAERLCGGSVVAVRLCGGSMVVEMFCDGSVGDRGALWWLYGGCDGPVMALWVAEGPVVALWWLCQWL